MLLWMCLIFPTAALKIPSSMVPLANFGILCSTVKQSYKIKIGWIKTSKRKKKKKVALIPNFAYFFT